MIDRNDDLLVSRQAKVLGISRGSVLLLAPGGLCRRSGADAPD